MKLSKISEWFKPIIKGDFFLFCYQRLLDRYPNVKINQSDVISVLHVAFDEMEAVVLNKKTFDIENFGTFTLSKKNRKKVWSVYEKKVIDCTNEPSNTLSFTIHPGVKKMLENHLDLDKTWESD